MSEFDLIYQHIEPLSGRAADVVLGIGDDAALSTPPAGQVLVSAMDTLVEGRHFFTGQSAYDIAWKALAVNLSDLAAMGAKPACALLSLALPQSYANSEWLSDFMRGWQALASQHQLTLIGGDTTRSEQLTLSVTVMGFRSADTKNMLRSAARDGDHVWVSGMIGSAGLALVHRLQHGRDHMVDEIAMRLHRPDPRVTLGQAVLPYAHAAIDISDGLLSDVMHVLNASRMGARIALDSVPMFAEVRAWASDDHTLPCRSGDDYELLFTAPPSATLAIQRIAQNTGIPITQIGIISANIHGLALTFEEKNYPLPARLGFDHFASS